MSDEHQVHLPDSFLALFIAPGARKPSASRAEVLQRYELCEDLANLLTDTAGTLLFQLGITEHDVLERCHSGLLPSEEGPPAVVSEAEAHWVITRLAELMGWAPLAKS